MHYVCIENNTVVGVLNYQPNVPNTVTVVTITDEQNQSIIDQTHYFDLATKTVVPVNPSTIAQKEQEVKNAVEREFLNSTDWKVLRHIRQKFLGIPTTLTEAEYLALEQQRNEASKRIL